MKCPNCRLINPPSAEYCDCGYRFATGKVDLNVSLPGSASDKARMDAQIVCPHCQTRGTVTTRSAVRKVGISGGKATGAVLTGGLSLLATGLSRKASMTEAHCSRCGSSWYF